MKARVCGDDLEARNFEVGYFSNCVVRGWKVKGGTRALGERSLRNGVKYQVH